MHQSDSSGASFGSLLIANYNKSSFRADKQNLLWKLSFTTQFKPTQISGNLGN